MTIHRKFLRLKTQPCESNMRLFLNFIVFIYCVTNIKTSIDDHVKRSILIHRVFSPTPFNHHARFKSNKQSGVIASILPKAKNYIRVREKQLPLRSQLKTMAKTDVSNDHFLIDPVLNAVKRRHKYKFRRNDESSFSNEVSSSLELENWKDEWQNHWKMKKYEATNDTSYRGDVVNMVAASKYCKVEMGAE